MKRIKSENQYAQKYTVEFLKCLYPQLDEKIIFATAQEEKFEALKIYEKLKNEKQNLTVEDSQEEEEDFELFPYICDEENENDMIENVQQQETSTQETEEEEQIVSTTQEQSTSLNEFLQIEDQWEAFKIFTSFVQETQQPQAVCLFRKVLEIHETALKKDIQTVEIFIDKLLQFFTLKHGLKVYRETIVFCFDELLELCFSYSDLLRLKSTQLLISLIEPQNVHQNYEKAKDISIMYHNLTNEKNWYTELKEHTFELVREKMTAKEACVLFRLNKIEIYAVGKLTDDEEVTLNSFKSKIDKHLKNFGGKGFVKLSSRSPKDSGFVSKKYSNFCEEMKNEWIEKYNLKVNSENEIAKSIQNAIEQICCVKCLQIESSDDAVSLLVKSQRTLVDLMIALEKNDSNYLDLELIIKRFYNFEICYEMRGFVRNKNLNALSQYFSKEYFPWITIEKWKTIKEKVLEFYDTKVKNIVYMKDFTIDFVYYQDEIKVIELNSFGEIAGAALFSWIDDEEVLYNGPFQFRVIKDEDLNVAIL